MRSKAVVAGLVWILVGSAVLRAESPAAPAGGEVPAHPGMAGVEAPPLAELLSLAERRSPRLVALAARLAAAEERVGPEGALANPMVEARLQNVGLGRWSLGDEEMSMLELGVRQTLPWPGKRQARRDLARAETATVAAELASARRELVREVTTLVARLYALDRERGVLEEAHELLELLAATVTARYGAGEGEQEAVLKVQLELAMHDERRIEVAGERAEVEADLRGLLDLPAGSPIGVVTTLPPVSPLPEGVARLAAERAAEVAVRRAMETASDRRLATERNELRPDFTAAGGVGLRGANDPVLLLGLGIELPFWRKSRQEPRIRAAEHDLDAVRAERREAEISARAAGERLLGSWWRLDGQLRLSSEAILPQSSAAFDAARTAYLHGQGDFSTVVEDYGRWLDARVAQARLEAERLAVRVQIAALLGEEGDAASPSPTSPAASPTGSGANRSLVEGLVP